MSEDLVERRAGVRARARPPGGQSGLWPMLAELGPASTLAIAEVAVDAALEVFAAEADLWGSDGERLAAALLNVELPTPPVAAAGELHLKVGDVPAGGRPEQRVGALGGALAEVVAEVAEGGSGSPQRQRSGQADTCRCVGLALTAPRRRWPAWQLRAYAALLLALTGRR